MLDFKTLQKIDKSKILEKLGLLTNEYFLATAHRSENVDDSIRLQQIFNGFIISKDDFN